MKRIITQRLLASCLILFVFITLGCTSLIGIDTYDKIAYQNATSIKAYEYAKGRPGIRLLQNRGRS